MFSLQSARLLLAILLALPGTICATEKPNCANLGGSPFYIRLLAHNNNDTSNYGTTYQDRLNFGNPISTAQLFHLHDSLSVNGSGVGGADKDYANSYAYDSQTYPRIFLFRPYAYADYPINCTVTANCRLGCRSEIDGVLYRVLEVEGNYLYMATTANYTDGYSAAYVEVIPAASVLTTTTTTSSATTRSTAKSTAS